MTTAPIRFTPSPAPLNDIEADWLALGITKDGSLDPPVAALDSRLGGEIARLREVGDLTGKHLDLVPLVTVRGIRAHRLLLVGLGPTGGLSRATVHDAFAAALRSITGRKFGRVALTIPTGLDPASAVLGACVGAIQGSFGPGVRMSTPARFCPDEFVVAGPKVTDSVLDRAHAEGDCLTIARDLVNTPPGDKHPEAFARRARELHSRVQCEVWDETRLEREGMQAILGVARGSAKPPRLVILRYQNAGDRPPLALVGKGVTFDSGGLSLKTNEQMVDMKSDMAGAAAVMAAIRAAAEMDLPVNLLGITPLVENMPGGAALKLGDVLRGRNGKTIEVLNTDAEGRLILADALAYAAEQRPSHIVDLATLTGACMIALGTEIAGLMTNDTVWGEKVSAAALRAGERAWPLPMDPDFEDLLKSKVADLKNVGPNRYGGAIAAGKFLEQFVGGVSWVHLDIAGPAWAEHESAARDTGGTGAFVRTLVELAATLEVP